MDEAVARWMNAGDFVQYRYVFLLSRMLLRASKLVLFVHCAGWIWNLGGFRLAHEANSCNNEYILVNFVPSLPVLTL